MDTTVVVRVWMPDRPGALGQVASRIGAVRGDVLGIEILEHGANRVVDELTVTLPDVELIGLLSAEIDAVDGVSVEDVRIVEADRVDPNLAALAAGAAMAEADPPRAARRAVPRSSTPDRSRLVGGAARQRDHRPGR